MLLGLAPAASAQEDDDADEGGESVRGSLIDRKGTRERDDDEPVPEVEITISSADGSFADTVTSDDDGEFELELPGPGDYTAELDIDTLPDEVGLAEGGERLEFRIRPNQSRPLLFQLGARERETTSRLDQIPQLAFEGLKFGLLIAIAAVGLSLIFGTTGLVNFAHGEMVTWGAIVAWWVNVDYGIHLVPATIIAVGIGAITGAVLDRGLWRPLRNRGMSLIAMMIVSIGLSLAARNLFQLLFGEVTRPYNDYVIQRGIDIGPITTAVKDLWSAGLALVVLVLVASMLQFTRQGKAIRAVSDNTDLASSSGIDVDRVILYVWATGGALATIGGILLAIDQRVQFDMGFKLLLLMFAGVTLGGLGTAYGALVGSFVVGMFIQLSTLVVPTELKNVGALAILILVLLLRPQGILGRAERIG
ncbi:MAG: branched-chain amino acid ABC transporter permease [Acidimicrobiales bacterium]